MTPMFAHLFLSVPWWMHDTWSVGENQLRTGGLLNDFDVPV